MQIEKITEKNIAEIQQIDGMFVDFQREEALLDANAKVLEDCASFAKDASKENVQIYVCKEGEKVLGFAYTVYVERRNMLEKVLHIAYVYVAKEERKKGIATRLLEAAVADAKEKNVHILDVTVHAGNSAACSLYAKMGFGEQCKMLRKKVT